MYSLLMGAETAASVARCQCTLLAFAPMAKTTNKTPPGTVGRLTVHIDSALARKVRVKAAEQGRRISDVVGEALVAYLKESR